MYKKTQVKFKTYKSDAAPFFFYIEVFPFDTSLYINPYVSSLIKTIERNPIVPLPMRVDRVSNGENSVIIRPREVTSFQISEEQLAVINPYQFLHSGIKTLIYFSEILNPSILIEENIITIINSKDYDEDFKKKNIWWKDFNNIKPDLFLDEMPQSFYK